MQPVPFGPYRVLGRLAVGGQAEIYLAAVEPGSVPVCLKLLRPTGGAILDREAMFVSEARITTMLRHENCVAAFEWGRVRSASYIALEYILGETVHDLINRSVALECRMPNAIVASIIAGACEGVHHLHELRDENDRPYGVIHRDLSPANLMLSQEGGVKVLDFGIVKANINDRPETRTGLVKGRPTYMSPEQITGRRIDRRSDVYTLGVILFECLGLRKLFAGPNTRSIAERILSGAPDVAALIPDAPPALAEICQRAIAMNADERFETAAEMGAALRAYVASTGERAGAQEIAVLLAERFGESLTLRRRALNRILDKTLDETSLGWLGATPVTAFELFGPGGDEPTEPPRPISQPASQRIARAEEARTVIAEPETKPLAPGYAPGATLPDAALPSVAVRSLSPARPEEIDQEEPTATCHPVAIDADVTEGLAQATLLEPTQLQATHVREAAGWVEATVVAEVPRFRLSTLVALGLFVVTFGIAAGMAVGLWAFMGR